MVSILQKWGSLSDAWPRMSCGFYANNWGQWTKLHNIPNTVTAGCYWIYLLFRKKMDFGDGQEDHGAPKSSFSGSFDLREHLLFADLSENLGHSPPQKKNMYIWRKTWMLFGMISCRFWGFSGVVKTPLLSQTFVDPLYPMSA